MDPNLNDYKYKDSQDIKRYYYSLTYKERVAYCDQFEIVTGEKRYKFFNWKNMSSHMPPEMKPILEDIAGCKIFSDDNR